MEIRKVFKRRVRASGKGVDVVGDVNAVISGNVGTSGTSHVSSRQRTRVVQQGRASSASEETEKTEGGA